MRVESLVKRYGGRAAVDGVSFSLRPGEVFALLGPNGAGKTTTIEVLEGFRRRDAGRVEVLGHDPAGRPRALRERIGIVRQEAAIEPRLPAREALGRHAGFYPRPRPVEEVLGLVGLQEAADSRVAGLSGGQQRRLDVALGIIANPDLVFLEEPTTGFDPAARRGAWDLVRALRGGGTTVLLTTHDMDEAEALADRVAVVARGRVVASGPPATIGGRDVGEATIRFRFPPGAGPGRLPVPARQSGDSWEIVTDDAVAVLHALTALGARAPRRPRRPRRRTAHPRGRLAPPHRRARRAGRALSAAAAPTAPPRHFAWLVAHQLRFEQLNFWRKRFAAVTTPGFAVVFLVLSATSASCSAGVRALGGARVLRYYVAGFAAYGVMSACYSTLAIQLVNRRETGPLKRLHLCPLPTAALFGALLANALVVSLVPVAVIDLVGRFGSGLLLPHQWRARACAVAVGSSASPRSGSRSPPRFRARTRPGRSPT